MRLPPTFVLDITLCSREEETVCVTSHRALYSWALQASVLDREFSGPPAPSSHNSEVFPDAHQAVSRTDDPNYPSALLLSLRIISSLL
jgi:hypothetical protein